MAASSASVTLVLVGHLLSSRSVRTVSPLRVVAAEMRSTTTSRLVRVRPVGHFVDTRDPGVDNDAIPRGRAEGKWWTVMAGPFARPER